MMGMLRPLPVRALLPRLRQKPAGDWRKTIETNVGDWWKTLEDRARQPAEPVNPQRVTWELSPRLPDRARRPARECCLPAGGRGAMR